jgi:hypothetical protein
MSSSHGLRAWTSLGISMCQRRRFQEFHSEPVRAIDEFVDYQSELDETMLQAARKFSTSLVLATQNLASIRPSLLGAIAANAATALVNRPGFDGGSGQPRVSRIPRAVQSSIADDSRACHA